MTRFVLAAVALLIAAVGLNLFRETGTVAWAIEESIRATDKYGAIHVEGFILIADEDGTPQPRSLRSWAVANGNQTGVEKERIDVDGVTIQVINGQTTWRYDPRTNSVIKNRPYGTPECWYGSRFLEQLKGFHDSGILTTYQVAHERDPTTGRQQIVLRCAWLDKRYNGPRSMRLEFDSDSRLMTRLQQWENAGWEGPARLTGDRIVYHETLADDLFEFRIPEGATVVEE